MYLYASKHPPPPHEACVDHYYVYLEENNSVRLKECSLWCIQIQGQMDVCIKQWCDFILYTKKGIAVDRINFDSPLYFEQEINISKHSNDLLLYQRCL